MLKPEKMCELCNKPISCNMSWCGSCSVKLKRFRNRLAAIKYKGSKCEICGTICKTIGDVAIFDFHHIDTNEKEFNISSKVDRLSWGKIKIELDKCNLLCSNCHRKQHNGHVGLEHYVFKYSGSLDIWLFVSKPTLPVQFCVCGKKLGKGQSKFCSLDCKYINRRKVQRPSIDVLRQDMAEMSWSAIGRKYGVSDNAARKWARKYGLI